MIRWCTETWVQVLSVQAPLEGVSLALGKSQEFIYVGTIDGSVLVYYSENLNLLFNLKVHTKLISKVLIRSEKYFLDEIISFSHDGCIGKSTINSLTIQISPTDLLDATKIDDHHFICCSSSGIYSLKFEEKSSGNAFSKRDLQIHRKISGFLKSPFYLTNRQVQVVSLLRSLRYNFRGYLIDCFVPHGLKIIISSCLNEMTRSHYHKGSREGPTRSITKEFIYKCYFGKTYDNEPQFALFIPLRLKKVFLTRDR